MHQHKAVMPRSIVGLYIEFDTSMEGAKAFSGHKALSKGNNKSNQLAPYFLIKKLIFFR